MLSALLAPTHRALAKAAPRPQPPPPQHASLSPCAPTAARLRDLPTALRAGRALEACPSAPDSCLYLPNECSRSKPQQDPPRPVSHAQLLCAPLHILGPPRPLSRHIFLGLLLSPGLSLSCSL